MATRKLNQPDNPEFLALLVNSIDRIAHNTADLTDAEKRIANRLHKRSLMSAAARVSRHFQAIPEQRRLQSFGALGVHSKSAFSRAPDPSYFTDQTGISDCSPLKS